MSTRKQRAASRANAQKSTGPRTTAGKAASRFNALKHGIDAKQQVMFSESAEDLAELAAEYHELHCPADADERFLVDTMINNEWRLRRLRCVEADLWLTATNCVPQTGKVGAPGFGAAFTECGPAFDRLQRIMNSCQRHYDRARKELKALQADRAAQDHTQSAPQPEEPKTTSESPASLRTNPETAPAPEPATASEAAQPSVDEQVRRPMEASGLTFQADL